MGMTPSGAVAILICAAVLMVLAMWWLIKLLVADKLNSIKAQLETLTTGMADHAETISSHNARMTAIETAMRINGCMEPGGKPRCAS